jgi:hypothetical protein
MSDKERYHGGICSGRDNGQQFEDGAYQGLPLGGPGLGSDEVRLGVARELFRFIRGETPTLDDFRSQGAAGKRMRFNTHDPDAVRRWHEGISVYDDLERAIELARGGGFAGIAMLRLAEPHKHEVSQFGRDEHHYTIFGSPEELLALVTDCRRIPKSPGE